MLALQPNEAKSADTTAAEVRSVRARVVVAYLCGVLRASSLKDQCQRLLSEFQKLMTDIATNKNGWTTDDYPLLEIVVRMLCKSDEALIADVVSLMWDMIVSPDAAIRATSPYLVQGLLLCCDVVTLRDRVLPAVITLSSDENMDVRVSTIPVFGHILESVNDKGVQDKIKMQLQSLLETDDVNALLLMFEVLSMLANIMPTIETSFRDDCKRVFSIIIPRLYDISCRTHQHNNDEVRVARVVALLVKTVVAAVQSELPLVVLQKYVQPTCDTLQMLPRTCVRVEDDETLAEISVECTERLSASNVAAHAISESLSTTKQKFKNFFNKNEDDDSHVDTNGMENMRNAMKTSTPPPGAATNAFANLFKTRG
ncbi:hypothetical protein SARC_06438 [Sphaeroforma arctica JP610]|uniref:Mot1 central domain-containing protein n=1 Tax=Sphaeroforma arctica JP610 TaxID=667725 RepID=A0A0L0FXE8_9EUKA|nr:hypothetical protein SARC_06438 [Sphaeroforma arctica JP610]KNC81226.1 hypothetical protein SARC_06438 [Sphaeroforma arctica JP610]|eukprot:XP_014155128.1 hypothetical protein SARC_06438 [Sphaeroforma arctica JP610]